MARNEKTSQRIGTMAAQLPHDLRKFRYWMLKMAADADTRLQALSVKMISVAASAKTQRPDRGAKK